MVTMRPERPDLRGEEGVWPSARAGDPGDLDLRLETLKRSALFAFRKDLRPAFGPLFATLPTLFLSQR